MWCWGQRTPGGELAELAGDTHNSENSCRSEVRNRDLTCGSTPASAVLLGQGYRDMVTPWQSEAWILFCFLLNNVIRN